jgi:hypothetical protein
MSSNNICAASADNQFGPRVAVGCRDFDFTLLFEDAFFGVLPPAVFLLFSGPRLRFLKSSTVKVTSHKLAVIKLVS